MLLVPCSTRFALRVVHRIIGVRILPFGIVWSTLYSSMHHFAASNFKPAQKVVAPRRLDTHRWIVLPASGVANAEDLHTIMLPRRATDREKERMIATGILGIAFLAFSCCRRPPTRLRRISYRNNAFLSGVDVLEPERMLVCCGRSTQRNAWCLTSL